LAAVSIEYPYFFPKVRIAPPTGFEPVPPP
jgi:hypothetical protein